MRFRNYSRALCVALTLIFSLSSCEQVPDTAGTGIIIGSDGWLFEETDGTYSELGDYTGERLFTDEQLDTILTTVKSKRSFFAKSNTDLIIVIIPDKMSLYSDKLPEEIQSQRASVSRLTQVYDYIKKNTRVSMVDLTEVFSMNSAAFDLYDRTGANLSDMGAYLAYTEIVKAVSALNISELKTASLDEFNVEVADDEGLEFAQRIGAEKKYKNKTITLTLKAEAPYISDECSIENTAVTEITEENREENYRYTNLILYGSDNLSSVSGFASLTFKSLVSVSGFVTDGETTSTYKPNQAVFLISEKELDILLDNETKNIELLETQTQTGSSGSDPDPVASSLELVAPDANTCAAPIVTGKTFSQYNRLAVAGVSENGTTIHVKGSDDDSYSYYVYDGIFLLDVPATQSTGSIEIYASADGKNDSEHVTVTITSAMGSGGKGVYVGVDGHIHIDATMYDYLGNNTYTASQAQSKRKQLEKTLAKIQAVSPDTKLIYMIAPNHSTIYPETMPDWLAGQKQDGAKSKLEMLYDAMEGSDVIFVNLTDLLLSKKNDGELDEYLLYQKTDTHWNELGAYYAYEYLMNEYIAVDFPAATATPLSDFDVFVKNVPGGDMLNMLGFDLDMCRENSVFVRPSSFELVTGYDKPYRMNFENYWTSDRHTYTIDNDALPTMLMYRDSFSTNLINLMAQNFSSSYFNEMFTHTVVIDLVKELQPDYVIVECVERNIENIF